MNQKKKNDIVKSLKIATQQLANVTMTVANIFDSLVVDFNDTFYIPDGSKFKIQELIHPDIINRYFENAWQFFDPRALWTQVALRDYWMNKYNKPTICNTYLWGGHHLNRGLRKMDWGGPNSRSPHKHGCGFDNIVPGIPSEELRKDILDKPNFPAFQFITRIEKGTTHIHWDTFNTKDRIYQFNP